MREIKFRAWHTAKKIMFSPEEMGNDQLTLLPDGRGFINVHGGDTRLSNLLPYMIPTQYTGLRDKHGKEIYEGDIVRYWHKTSCCGKITSDDDFVVKFIDGGFFMEKIGNPSYLLGFAGAAEDREVIGDIFVNPELAQE